MKLGENSQVEEIAYLQWYSIVQTFPSLSTIIGTYLPKRHTKWCRCTFAWGCPDTAHNPSADLLGRLCATCASQTSELQARYKKNKAMLLCRDWKLLVSYQNSSCKSNSSFVSKQWHDPIFTCVTAKVSCHAAVPARYKLLQESLK